MNAYSSELVPRYRLAAAVVELKISLMMTYFAFNKPSAASILLFSVPV